MRRNQTRRDRDDEFRSRRDESDLRPEGLLLLKVSEKVQIRVELSDFTGEDEVAIIKWVKTAQGWTRTKGGIRLDPAIAKPFCKKLYKALGELL